VSSVEPAFGDWSRAWASWTPRERATLLFLRRDGRLLLIEKKRGFGAGKVNAPGGRIAEGETPAAAAVREAMEEVGLRPLDPTLVGSLSFQFADGYSIHATVFLATRAEGAEVETPEAVPFWVAEDAIPYERMWTDDRVWLPHVLAGRTIAGRFWFDGDRMVRYGLSIGPAFR